MAKCDDNSRGGLPSRVGRNKVSDLYPLTDIVKYAPNRAGVYYLVKKVGDMYELFYIGQSKNIQSRLISHNVTWENRKRNACIVKNVKEYDTYFLFVRINKLEKRDRIEQEQIEKYKPECNMSRGLTRDYEKIEAKREEERIRKPLGVFTDADIRLLLRGDL